MLQAFSSQPQGTKILVVDDEKSVAKMLQKLIEHLGYNCHAVFSGEDALQFLKENPVDLIITDIRMPGITGIDVLTEARQNYDCDVIVMTGYTSDFSYETVISKGASDFVYKPFTNQELRIRLQRVIRERALFREITQAHSDLKFAYRDTINRLVLAAEYKDEDTGEHIVRMSRYSALIAEKYGLEESKVRQILYASPMHDIGKMGIPDSILLKTGKLTSDEFDVIKTHTTIGANILANAQSPILQAGHTIALTHHEKWDGSGYPQGLAGEDIDIMGRIAGLADVFDALTSARPYKKPYPIEIALDIIHKEKGRHFDPNLVPILEDHIDEFIAIQASVNQAPEQPLSNIILSERDCPPADS